MSIIMMFLFFYLFAEVFGWGLRLTWDFFKFFLIAAIVIAVVSKLFVSLLPVFILVWICSKLFKKA